MTDLLIRHATPDGWITVAETGARIFLRGRGWIGFNLH